MKFRNLEVILLLAIGLVIAQSAESQVKASGAGGILLEAVGPESALEKAGLLAGDVLLSWDREVRGANGEFLSWDPGGKLVDYAQWIDVEIDKAPRGDIRVHGIRGIDEFTAVIKHGPWNRLSRPLLEKD